MKNKLMPLFVILVCLACGLPTLSEPLATPIATELPTVTPPPQCLVVTANTLNLRKLPTVHSPVLDWLSVGNELELIRTVGNWYYVDTGTIVGYVNSKFVEECE